MTELSDFGLNFLRTVFAAFVSVDVQVWFTDPIYGFLRKPSAESLGPMLPENDSDPENHNPADLSYLDECAALAVKHKGVYRWKDGDTCFVSCR